MHFDAEIVMRIADSQLSVGVWAWLNWERQTVCRKGNASWPRSRVTFYGLHSKEDVMPRSVHDTAVVTVTYS